MEILTVVCISVLLSITLIYLVNLAIFIISLWRHR